jgi:ferredoxin
MSLVHALTAEQSRFRRWTLYLFARYLEMPVLGWSYHLLRGRYRHIGAIRPVRAALGWGAAMPFAYLGDTARPLPAPQVLRLIDALEGPIAVGPCRCRAAHQGCDHPLETDLVIRTGVEAFSHAFPRDYRLVGSLEAKAIVSESSRLGMWQMVFVHCPVHEHGAAPSKGLDMFRGRPGNEYVICNCCRCGCVPYIVNRELGQRVHPLLRGPYTAHTDLVRFTGHGGCVTACPFGARAMADGKVRLVAPCFGCGVCVAACPEGAIQMREV